MKIGSTQQGQIWQIRDLIHLSIEKASKTRRRLSSEIKDIKEQYKGADIPSAIQDEIGEKEREREDLLKLKEELNDLDYDLAAESIKSWMEGIQSLTEEFEEATEEIDDLTDSIKNQIQAAKDVISIIKDVEQVLMTIAKIIA